MHVAARNLRTVLDAGADLLLGASCPGCEAPGLGLCADCTERVRRRRPRPVTLDPAPWGFPACTTTGPYDDLARGLVVAFKERQSLSVGPVLGRLLARSAATAIGSATAPTLIVPVPSHPAVVRARGLDAAGTITRLAGRRLRRQGLDVRTARLLRLRRRVADQTGLGAVARRQNLRGALLARPGQGRVLLVDDLVTTGATLAEAARALEAGGWTVVGAAVVAATARRPARPSAGPSAWSGAAENQV